MDKVTFKKIRDKNNRLWEYIPVKEAKNLNISHKNIVGDVLCSTREKPITILEKGGKKLDVYPYKETLGYSEKIIGYIPYDSHDEEELFVRIVKKSKSKIIAPIILILLLLLGGIWWFFIRDTGPNLDNSAIAYQLPNGAKNEDPESIMLPGYDSLTIDQNTTEVNAALINPEGNPCYFVYNIVIPETNEVLYKSEYIKPGTAIPKFTLNKKLAPGEYNLELRINTYMLEDYTVPMNGGVVATKLIVKES